ncbi:MAG: IPT/TIG domain-containing protein [Deltaproteobacteria bacterium]|nr:IPT/TIG domain-containing protein [Deltaproteobacteria bacterium]
MAAATFCTYSVCNSSHVKAAASYGVVLGGAGHTARPLEEGAALEETLAVEVPGEALDDGRTALVPPDEDGGACDEEAEPAAEDALDGAAAEVAANDVVPADDDDGTLLVAGREPESEWDAEVLDAAELVAGMDAAWDDDGKEVAPTEERVEVVPGREDETAAGTHSPWVQTWPGAQFPSPAQCATRQAPSAHTLPNSQSASVPQLKESAGPHPPQDVAANATAHATTTRRGRPARMGCTKLPAARTARNAWRHRGTTFRRGRLWPPRALPLYLPAMPNFPLALVLPVCLILGGSSCGNNKPEPPPAPKLKTISPPIGDLGGGQTVTLKGENLGGASEVKFGAVAAAVPVVAADGLSLTCLTPPGARGTVAVSVTTPGGTDTVQNAFTYVTQVFITALEPDHVPANQESQVTIRGRGLIPPMSVKITGPNDVSVNAVVGTGTDQAVAVTIPALDVGSYQLTATNGENQLQTSPIPLTVTEPIRVTLIDPDSGFADEELLVRIEGTGFTASTGVTAVLAGTAPCTDLLVEDDTHISCRIPPGTAGAVDVTVRRSVGDETKVTNGFTWHSPTDATVRILYADPRNGRSTGGQETLIAATGVSGQTPTVTIGGAAATVLGVVDGKRVRVQLPSHAVAGLDVSEKVAINLTAGSGTDTKQNAFTFYVRPGVGTISPVKGATVGGDRITMFGEGFTARHLRVTFDGAEATEVTRLDGLHLTCRVPPHSAGFVDVQVFSEFDASDVAVGAFEYREAVRITALDPPTASIAGGTIVEAQGSGYVAGRMEVKVDGVVVDNPTVQSNSRMRFVMPRRNAVATVQVSVRDTAGTDAELSTGTISLDYQDKTIPGGGVTGGIIKRNISVSVVRQDNGAAVSGATVFLGDSWQNATYKGATDDKGMLVLAASDLSGPVTITAARTGYENQTRLGLNAGEVTFALLPYDWQNPTPGTPATITGTVGNWAAAGYPLGYAPGVVKRVAVLWLAEPDQGFGSPNPGPFNVIAEEPNCDVTINNANTALPTSFTLDAAPGGQVALMAVVYFYDSKNGVCNPEAPPGQQQANPEGESFLLVTAGAVGLLTDFPVRSGTNPGANVPINRTVTDGMVVNLVGAPALGGAGQTARTVDAVLDVGASGVFTFFNPIADTATVQMNQSLPAAGLSYYSGADFMNAIPSAVPAPGGDLKYILHGIAARPAVEQGQIVGYTLPYSEVWKRAVTGAQENLENWYEFPTGMSPGIGGTLQNRAFSWGALTQASSFVVADVGQVDGNGNITPRWTIFMPGDTTQLTLPTVSGAGDTEDLQSGTLLWQVSAYALFESDGFNFQDHQVGNLGEAHWRARAASDLVDFQLP